MSKVAEILSEMAQNAGQAALRRGAIIGGTIEQAANIPAQYAADMDRKKLEDLHAAQVQQQMGLEAARGQRETQLATSQAAKDAKDAQTASHLNAIIGAGFQADPSQFDMTAATKAAQGLGRADLIPTVAAVHDKLGPQIETAPEGSAARFKSGPNIGTIVPNSQVEPKASEADIALKAAGGDPAKAMELLKPKPAPTAEADTARYLDIQTRKKQGLPVLPLEQAWSDSYEKNKTLSVDTGAAAANDRLSRTIDQQNKLNLSNHQFEVTKEARADIQKNADTPYQSAQSAADELRSMVTAAQSGNKIAASEQALTTAAATIRGFGLNRINMAEIGMPAGAGSAADRVSNFIGKWTEGQPVDPGLQKDMLQVADVLEKAARKKYENTHAGINKLYGTDIPQTFPAEPATTAAPSLAPSYADYLASKKKP
jgi:hypothetical protein